MEVTAMQKLLEGVELRDVPTQGLGPRAVGLALGEGASPLEILVFESEARPSSVILRDTWKRRWAGRAAPVVIAAQWKGGTAICGPSESGTPPIIPDVPTAVADALLRAALAQPDRHSARQFLDDHLHDLDQRVPGLRNEGLFATHNLQTRVRDRGDWAAAAGRALPARTLRGEELLKALGFSINRGAGQCLVLRHGESKVALAVLVDRGTSLDLAHPAFNGESPVSYGLNKADNENLRWLVVVEGSKLRLYTTDTAAGVGRRGRTETFVQADLDMLGELDAAYLWLLFSAEGLARGGSVEDILSQSRDYAVSLAYRLRERIYTKVMPVLAQGVAGLCGARRRPGAEELRDTYQQALTILFRLLFVAYGEDRLLLPYRTNKHYAKHSLKQKARDYAEEPERTTWDEGPTLRNEVWDLFRAVDKGKADWAVPAYNGGLFSSDPDVSPLGASLEKLFLPDSVLGPVLDGLLVDETLEGVRGPVDFRSLGVREFGTIYEGLLESDLAVAECDLTTDKDGVYVPAKSSGKREPVVVVREGEVYLHNRAGARKATGSFFTKPFVVDHLVEQALAPALRDHLARLDKLLDDEAAAAFFDFRVADIAMGSGHFLVAAVDRIERALSGYLSGRPLPKVRDELARLRRTALDAAAKVGAAPEIEDGQLLRRQIARRCVYGVDLNPMSVDLARLSIWIHTFVPGLPLSFLDHSLVRGNSLIGVATVEEAMDALGCGQIFGGGIRKLLQAGKADLERLGQLSDADRAEIQQARSAAKAAAEKAAPLREVFDYVVAMRIDDSLRRDIPTSASAEAAFRTLREPALQKKVRQVLAAVPPLHFPVAFPEVFLRERAGFDAILGNPPWEEVTVERHRFWGRHVPGLMGLKQSDAEREIKRIEKARPDLVDAFAEETAETDALRKVLLGAGYAGMGTGDPDLYKAFVWRFWFLVGARGGRIGVVLPRVVFQAKGCEDFRKALIERGEIADLTFLLNRAEWVFEDVEPRYTIALASLTRTESPSTEIPLRGPYTTFERFDARHPTDGARFQKCDFLSWTDTAAFPLLPTEESAAVFVQLRKSPRLDLNRPGEWRARPYREFDATNDKKQNGGVIDVTSPACPRGHWPVFKGESFDLWDPDTGSYYGWADPKEALPELEKRRQKGRNNQASPFSEFARNDPRLAGGQRTLSCQAPRIAFRDVTRATDTRTVRVALCPGRAFHANTAPVVLWARGDERDQAYLLGVLSSRPLDWYGRRSVEIHVNFHIFNSLPMPRPPRTSPLWKRTVELAGRLACLDERFADFARAVGVKCGPLGPDEKQDHIHELDAVVAHLYGLDAAQLRHVFETFHEGWDCTSDLAATLAHFDAWRARLP